MIIGCGLVDYVAVFYLVRTHLAKKSIALKERLYWGFFKNVNKTAQHLREILLQIRQNSYAKLSLVKSGNW